MAARMTVRKLIDRLARENKCPAAEFEKYLSVARWKRTVRSVRELNDEELGRYNATRGYRIVLAPNPRRKTRATETWIFVMRQYCDAEGRMRHTPECVNNGASWFSPERVMAWEWRAALGLTNEVRTLPA